MNIQNFELSPRARVEMLYARFPQERTFVEDESLHRLTGYVIEDDDFFLMGRPVKSDAPVEAICSPHVEFAREESDAWFIWAFAGQLKMLLGRAPFELPFLGWIRRDGGVRFYRFKDVERHVIGMSQMVIFTRLA